MRGKSAGEIAGMIIFGILFITGLAILFGFVIMWLWNWLMPMIFGLTTLTYWEAVGVFILFKILLGGCGGFGGKDKKGSKKSKEEFSKWKHYDDFWKEEGNKAYEAYVDRLNSKEASDD
jgi:hypothetical protein